MATVDIINSMKEHIQGAYTKIETLGGTIPAEKNLANLESAIGTVKTGTDTSDATATADDILLGKTAYAKGEKLTGTIETYAGDGGETVNKLASLVDGTLTEVTAEDLAGATKIIRSAFSYNPLISITIPNSVTSIGDYAFDYCTSLTNITISYGVTSIGTYAFEKCGSLTSIIIPNSITSIGNGAFYYCTSLASVTISNSVTSIGRSTFYNCTSLTSVTIPNSVTSIGNQAFQNCTSLTSVTIPNSVTSIGNQAFYNCTSLTSITIPNSVTSIGGVALQIGSSTNKATITMLPTTPPTIQSSTFDASYLQKIIVPAGTGATYKAATNWSNFADYIEEATA